MRHALESKDSSNSKAPLTHLRGVISFAAPYSKQLAATMIALIITSSSVLGLGKGAQYFIDHGLLSGNPHALDQALAVLVSISLILACGTFTRYYFITQVGERVVADIKKRFYRHLLVLSPEFYETHTTGDLLSRMQHDTAILQIVVGSSLSVALRNTILLIGGISLLLYTSPKLTLIVMGIVPLVVVPIIVMGKSLRRLSKTAQERVGMLSSHTEETLYGMRAIQSFCQESERATLFDGAINNALDAIKQRIRIRALLSATVIALVFTAIGVVLWIGGKDLLLGKITPGELSSFLFYALVVAGATGAISDVIGDMQRAAGATERIMDFLAISPNISSPKNPRALPSPVKGSVVFDHVTFFYPTRPDTAALNDISFCVNPGERVAIVGASGAGKSTLFELLLRFYEPQYGTITLDDVRIDECDISELRSQMGLVPQSPVIFSASIHDNIALANSHATDAEIQRAAQQAHAIEFIDRLPETFQTMVGEKGVMLSGGQKQRLAIARVFLQRAPLLLLDEATSALDANSEAAVQEAFDELMQSHTTLVIAHRLSTVLKADRILVMEHGRIIEQGTHAELLKKKGHYAKLAKMQFLNQQDPAADAKNTDVGHAV